jgi:hypothetical protein
VCGAATDWALRALRVLAPNGASAPASAASFTLIANATVSRHDRPDEDDVSKTAGTDESAVDSVEPARSKRAKHTTPLSEHDRHESAPATVAAGSPFAWVDAIAIATCCHHRCEWQFYTGR